MHNRPAYLWPLKSLILGSFFLLLLFTSTICVVVEVVGATVVVVVVVICALSVTRMGFLGALEAVEEGTLALTFEMALPPLLLTLPLPPFLIQGGTFLALEDPGFLALTQA